MKKLLIACAIFIFALSCQVFGAQAPNVYLDGKLFQFHGEKPYVDGEGTLFLPAESIESLFWCSLSYNDEDKTTTITKNDTVIVFQDNNTQYTVNGEKIVMPFRAGIQYLPGQYIAQALNAEAKYDKGMNRVDIIGGIYTLKEDLNLDALTEGEIERILQYSPKYPAGFLDSKMLAYERILGSADTVENARSVVYERFKEVNVYPTSITLKLDDTKYYGFTVTWNYYPENSKTAQAQSAEVIVTKDSFYDFPEMTFRDLNTIGIRDLLNLMYYVETYNNDEIQVLKTSFSYGKETFDHMITYLELSYGETGQLTYQVGRRTYQVDNKTGFVSNVKKEYIELKGSAVSNGA